MFLLVVAFAMATGSIVSAAKMAPEAQTDPALASYLAVGGSWAELCGDDPAGVDHRCEYCNLVADVRPIGCTPSVDVLAFDVSYPLFSNLILGPLMARSDVSARAPPVSD